MSAAAAAAPATPAAPDGSAIAVGDVTVRLGGRTVLVGVNLAVTAGEVVALLGANGSGKSTLVRTVLGLVPRATGSVHLLGSPLAGFRSWDRVGYVPQRVTATAGVPATVAEVVAAGRLTASSWWRPPTRTDRVETERAIAAVGLAEHGGRSVSALSGGQQQRVLIARALVRRPELLLLDEPTSGVDRASQDALAAALHDLVERGTTVVLVLHELGVLAPLIQRAVVLRAGRVVHDGAPPPASPLHAGPDHDHVHPHGDDHLDRGEILP